MVEVTWDGQLLACEILRLSDDHSDLLFLQRALTTKPKATSATDSKVLQIARETTKSKKVSAAKGTAEVDPRSSRKRSKSKERNVPAPKKTATGRKAASVIARFCEEEEGDPSSQKLTTGGDEEALQIKDRADPGKKDRMASHGEDLAESDKESLEVDSVQMPYFPEVTFLSANSSCTMDDTPDIAAAGASCKRSMLIDDPIPSPVWQTSTPLHRVSSTLQDPKLTRLAEQVNDIWEWMQALKSHHSFLPLCRPAEPKSPPSCPLAPEVLTPVNHPTIPAATSLAPLSPVLPKDPHTLPPTTLSPATVCEARDSATSVPNYALSLVRKLFTEEEMKVGNCKGVKGKHPLDPQRLKFVKQEVAKHPEVIAIKFNTYWKRDCIRAIDEGCRRLNRSVKSASNV
ncbi:uncharacterized protein LOC110990900 [Acanthaster planci]|uniref:Uncharacterized protein LOC110990900 n=1 Tax=Acanthaster planci TaxID=133434 RepID=A0A8B8A6Q1_ACAPL|nr:uncharacterized protein LOC110990900 [Acanthaster planci]